MLFFSDVFYLSFFLFKKDLAGGALFQKGSKKGSVAASANAECLYVARTTKKEREKGNVIPALKEKNLSTTNNGRANKLWESHV